MTGRQAQVTIRTKYAWRGGKIGIDWGHINLWALLLSTSTISYQLDQHDSDYHDGHKKFQSRQDMLPDHFLIWRSYGGQNKTFFKHSHHLLLPPLSSSSTEPFVIMFCYMSIMSATMMLRTMTMMMLSLVSSFHFHFSPWVIFYSSIHWFNVCFFLVFSHKYCQQLISSQ